MSGERWEGETCDIETRRLIVLDGSCSPSFGTGRGGTLLVVIAAARETAGPVVR